MLHIPYKGGAPAITDLLGERISFMPINPLEVLPHIKAQKLRVLAVASDKRLALFPDVPTFGEAGLPGFEATVWWGLAAPAKTPRDVVVKLNVETNRVLRGSAVAKKLGDMGVVITAGTPDRFCAAYRQPKTELWSTVIKKAGIRPDGRTRGWTPEEHRDCVAPRLARPAHRRHPGRRRTGGWRRVRDHGQRAGPGPATAASALGQAASGSVPGQSHVDHRGFHAGGARGVGHDLGRELARRLAVPFEPVVFPKNADVLAAVKSGQVDVTFTNATAARAKDMDFSAPLLEVEQGFLVAPASPVAALAEVDRTGMRVGVSEGSTSESVLSREFRHAVIVRAPTIKDAIGMLSAGKLDAFATNKAILFEMSDDLPGSRVLDGRWGLERFAFGIPKGRDQGLDFMNRFVQEANAEGLVTRAVDRTGLRGTLAVPPR